MMAPGDGPWPQRCSWPTTTRMVASTRAVGASAFLAGLLLIVALLAARRWLGSLRRPRTLCGGCSDTPQAREDGTTAVPRRPEARPSGAVAGRVDPYTYCMSRRNCFG